MRGPIENSGICVLLMNGNTERAGLVLRDSGRVILMMADLFLKYVNFQHERHNPFSRLKK